MFREKLREFGGQPHLNIPTIGFLELIINKDCRILEFGSGSSTLWFAERGKFIISYESEKEWWIAVVNEAAERKIMNLDVRLEPRYWECFEKQMKGREYDIILIDGGEYIDARESCVRKAWKFLARGGYFVMDDTHRERYKKEMEFINGFNWKRWEMIGEDYWGNEKRATAWRRE